LIINGSDYPTPDGTCIRDYVSVNDVALYIHDVLANDNFDGNIHNVATGIGTSNLEIAEMVNKIVDGGLWIATVGNKREGDPAFLVGEPSSHVYYHTNLEEIIKKTERWYRNL
jgi:UDP-glucose 4-epimerase